MSKIKATGGIKIGGTLRAGRFNIPPAWDTVAGSLGTPFENAVFSVNPGATDPDTFPDANITYSVSNGSLPGGLSLNSSTGEISGTTDPVGSDTLSNFTLRAADGNIGANLPGKFDERAFSITILNNVAPSFDQAANFSIGSVAELAAASLFQITATDPNTNPQTITFSEVGAVLTGDNLALNSDGTVTGTPPDSGGTRVVTFTVRASDSILTTDQDYKLTITDAQDPVWVTAAGALTAGSVGSAYSETVVATDDNTIAYSITSGALPAGTTLNSSTGEISGTPTTSESASFEVTATDTIELDATARSFSIEVSSVIAESVRFNDDDSAKLTKTWGAAATNNDIVSFSVWVKRGDFTGATQMILRTDTSNTSKLMFDASDKMELQINAASGVNRIVTTRVFRDPSAWYHILAVVNTPSATANERLRIYVNGVEETDFDTRSNPAQNLDALFNKNSSALGIGSTFGGSQFLDGYLAEYHLIDGQALTPSSFGETDNNGNWIPKAYEGTYGTNGFYLDFADNTNYGNDVSGNNNDFTDSGLATNDQVSDTPTNNYSVFNVIDTNGIAGSLTFTDGNLRMSTGDRAIWDGSIAVSSGKWTWETNIASIGTNADAYAGIRDAAETLDTTLGNGIYYVSDGTKTIDGTGSAYGATFVASDLIRTELDIDGGNVEFFKNNVSQGTIALSGSTGSGLWVPSFALLNSTNASSLIVEFGQHTFVDTPTADFLALNTSNLPTPTIEDPSTYFQTHIYTGNASAHSETFTGNSDLQPDLVWIKNRSQTDFHRLVDAVRGVTKEIYSNDVANEVTDANGVTAFNTDGFTLGTGAGGYNDTGESFVSWNWKEGAIPGFDIVSYSGTGANRTVAHSLSAAPDLMFVKGLNTTTPDNWIVYHSSNTSAPETDFLILNETNATVDAITPWNDTSPTSSVFTVGTSNAVNEDTKNFIAYLWAEVEGFSKFGFYTGNGDADGPFVWCGFKPAYVMLKRSVGGVGNWETHDSLRSPNNYVEETLYANISGAEIGTGDFFDILSNGFKLRDAADDRNLSGSTYIFAAFAETPFKTATAR